MERIESGAVLIGFVLATACISQASAGQDSGWYAGAGVGQSSFDLAVGRERFFVENYAQGGATDSYQVLGGFRTSPYLALEVAYVHASGHTSEFTLDCGGRATCQGLRYDVRETARSQRLDMAVIATLPIGQRVELFGKLGLSRSRQRLYRTFSSGAYDPDGLAYDDMNTGLVKGWGARFMVSPAWAIRGQHEIADDVGGPRQPTSSLEGRAAVVENWWLGAEYRF